MILSPAHPMQLVLGPIVWSLYFVLLYGGLSVGCAVAPPDPSIGSRNAIKGLLLVLTVATVVLLTYWSCRCWRASDGARENEQPRFVARVAAGTHLAAAVAVLAIGLPVVGLPPCV